MGARVGGSSNVDAVSTMVLPRAGEAESKASPSPLSRQCTCGGTLTLHLDAERPRTRSRRRAQPARNGLLYFCRTCKKQLTFPTTAMQLRRCVIAMLAAGAVCGLAVILFYKMVHRSRVPMIGATAVALGLCLWLCQSSMSAFLRGRRNLRRYPLEDSAGEK